MSSPHPSDRLGARAATRLAALSLGFGLLSAGACARATSAAGSAVGMGTAPVAAQEGNVSPLAPNPDRRVGLRAGLWDAAEASWNMQILSNTRPSEKFLGSTNSDLAFLGNYAIQGNYNGFQVWDISNPRQPTLKTAFYCPASQSDVSVYRNLLFVSAEGLGGRLDCGGQGVPDTVSS